MVALRAKCPGACARGSTGGRFRDVSLILAISLACLPGLLGAKRSAQPTTRPPAAEMVDLFEAVAAGQIDVLFVPRDSQQARLSVTNKTTRPLTVRLPDGFAAMPVLAQMGNFGNNSNVGAGMNNGNRPQALGVLPSGNGNNNQMNPLQQQNPGRGFFNVAAGRTVRRTVACVCLEYGLPEPRSSMKYAIAPLEEFSSDAALAALLSEYGRGSNSQRIVQAAAWNLGSGMSWDDLERKRIETFDGPGESYFTQAEIESARQLVERSKKAASATAAAADNSSALNESTVSNERSSSAD